MSLSRVTRLTLSIASLTVLAAIAPAYAVASWLPGGTPIKATNAFIPLVSACSDGAFGTFVAWQEATAPGVAVLRLQHVLSSGDVDPTWPSDGAVACSRPAYRPQMRVLADHLGGVYIWWKENGSLYLIRVSSSGSVAGGWPTDGRVLGVIDEYGSSSPSAIEDGGHGIYIAWSAASLHGTCALGLHIGPDNQGVAGWPNVPLAVAPDGAVASSVLWPQIALANDGGLFVAWGTSSADTMIAPAGWQLRRLTAGGAIAPSWPWAGRIVFPFHFELADEFQWGGQPSSLLALCPDGRGGVFVEIAGPLKDQQAMLYWDTRVLRIQGSGEPAIDWPAGGSRIDAAATYYYPYYGDDGSLQTFPDGVDGVLAGFPEDLAVDRPPDYSFLRLASTGQVVLGAGLSGGIFRKDILTKGDGGAFRASVKPCGPSGPYDPDAALWLSQSNSQAGWVDFWEFHDVPGACWYGDAGLASSGDGGAVLFWSQNNERYGLFARRFRPSGEVTAVGDRPSAATSLSALRFHSGSGVGATVSLPLGASGLLTLFDVVGRRVAATQIEGGGMGVEVTLPGTSELRTGLYFARLLSGSESLTGRVLVTR